MKKAKCYFLFVMMILGSGSLHALEKKSICVWDPVGVNGPVMTFYSDLKAKAMAWGIDLEFKAYTDEKVASNDFKAGLCDGAHLSAIISRDYVPFAGTLDAIGGLISDDGLNKILATLASPKAGELMVSGKYEMVASFPVGSMFVFVNDKSINSVPNFSGKKISVLNGDPQAMKMANLAGASPVNTSLATFSGQFNNGNIDILLMPALAYTTFELYHGLGEKGGILDYRWFYGMLQTIIKKDNFPPDFGENMRNYVVSRLNEIHKMVQDAEQEIPAKYWIKTNKKTQMEFDTFSREIRLALKTENTFDSKALRILWKIRCTEDPSRAECLTPE
tara:strand:+ start:9385 stop:10383 length:999 start_codon:yes stop_codon:yes gene_type:complete